MQVSEEIREQAKQEAAEEAERNKMSTKQIARLQTINATNKADKEAEAKFIADFKRCPKDTWTLIQMFKRIFKTKQTAMTVKVEYDVESDGVTVMAVPKASPMSDETLERMANKLIWSMQRGWFPASVSDIMFISKLTPDELAMGQDKFYRHLEQNSTENPILLYVKESVDKYAPTRLPVPAGMDINGLSVKNQVSIRAIGFDAWVESLNQREPKLAVVKAKVRRDKWTPEYCRTNHFCKAARLCLFAAPNGRPKAAAEGKQFCGKVCQEAYPIRLNNQKSRLLAA